METRVDTHICALYRSFYLWSQQVSIFWTAQFMEQAQVVNFLTVKSVVLWMKIGTATEADTAGGSILLAH